MRATKILYNPQGATRHRSLHPAIQDIPAGQTVQGADRSCKSGMAAEF